MIVLYILIAMVTVGSLTPNQIAGAADFALSEAAKPSLGKFGFTLVALSTVLATSAINATLYGSARLAYTIAEESALPAFLEKKLWNQPIAGLLLTVLFALLLANVADLSSISANDGSAGFLIIFAAVNAANVAKAQEVNSSKVIAGLGVVACLLALGALVLHTLQNSPGQLWVLVIMVSIAFRRRRDRCSVLFKQT